MSYRCSQGSHCVHWKKAQLRMKIIQSRYDAAEERVCRTKADLNFHQSQYEKFKKEEANIKKKTKQYSEKIEKLFHLVDSGADDEVLVNELTDLLGMTRDTTKKREIQKTADRLKHNKEENERQRQLCIAGGFTDIHSPD